MTLVWLASDPDAVPPSPHAVLLRKDLVYTGLENWENREQRRGPQAWETSYSRCDKDGAGGDVSPVGCPESPTKDVSYFQVT